MKDGCGRLAKLSALDCTVELGNMKQPHTSRPVGLRRAQIADGRGYESPKPANVQNVRKARCTALKGRLISPSVSFS